MAQSAPILIRFGNEIATTFPILKNLPILSILEFGRDGITGQTAQWGRNPSPLQAIICKPAGGNALVEEITAGIHWGPSRRYAPICSSSRSIRANTLSAINRA